MEKIPSWEANSYSVSREIPRLLGTPKVHYRVHNSPWLVCPEADRFSPHLPPWFPKIHSNIIFRVLSCFQVSRSQFCIHFSSRACYVSHPSHSPVFDTLIISGDVYKLWSSSLCSLFHPSAILSVLGSNTLISILFSETLNCVLLFVWETKFHTHTKQQIRL